MNLSQILKVLTATLHQGLQMLPARTWTQEIRLIVTNFEDMAPFTPNSGLDKMKSEFETLDNDAASRHAGTPRKRVVAENRRRKA
jgi:hypothetical protein